MFLDLRPYNDDAGEKSDGEIYNFYEISKSNFSIYPITFFPSKIKLSMQLQNTRQEYNAIKKSL